jgi:hypothetical protein
MNPKKILGLILPLAVLVLTLEILWRRLIVGQVPTQFSAFFVYALILANLYYVASECMRWFNQQKRSF